MAAMSPAYAKNIMRKTLCAITDLELTVQEKAKIWKYFNSTCAYCDISLREGKREGHMDHLISGGTNHISNRVLSCGPCNGDGKRDRKWQIFLQETASSSAFRKRRAKIEAWCRLNKRPKKYVVEAAVQKEIDRLTFAFDTAVKRLRRLRA